MELLFLRCLSGTHYELAGLSWEVVKSLVVFDDSNKGGIDSHGASLSSDSKLFRVVSFDLTHSTIG